MNAYLARGVGNWDLIKRTPPTPSFEEGLLRKTNKQTNLFVLTDNDSSIPEDQVYGGILANFSFEGD